MQTATAIPDSGEHLERDWLHGLLEELSAIERPSASEGEQLAAAWVLERLGELDAEARIEREDAHGTYWWPLGIAAAAIPSGHQ